MRILTGIFRGRNIEMPKGIRPTQQKVRKAIFDIFSERVKKAVFLELFAGSGAVGIEALSNGTAEVTFVEKDKDCLKILKKNLFKLGPGNYHVISADSLTAIKYFEKENKRFDLIFLDPPYYPECSYSKQSLLGIPKKCISSHGIQDEDSSVSLAKKTLISISNYDILNPNGFVIVQHHKSDKLPKSFSNLILYKNYSYADNQLSLYEKG